MAASLSLDLLDQTEPRHWWGITRLNSSCFNINIWLKSFIFSLFLPYFASFKSTYIVHGSDLLSKVLCWDVEYVGVWGGGEKVGKGLWLGVPEHKPTKLDQCSLSIHYSSMYLTQKNKTNNWYSSITHPSFVIHYSSIHPFKSTFHQTSIHSPLPPPVRPNWLLEHLDERGVRATSSFTSLLQLSWNLIVDDLDDMDQSDG